MIISHKYRFIFIKTNKTAGTSIEIALSKYCTEKDVITPIVKADEELRKRWGGMPPQNYKMSLSDIINVLLFKTRPFFYWNHIPARFVKAMVGKEIWDNYYKFCVERNPWDRVISSYYWHFGKSDKPISIAKFLDSHYTTRLKKRGYGNYTENGRIIVDRIILYENLQEEMNQVVRELGLDNSIVLPVAKGRSQKSKLSRYDFFDEQTRDKVADIFSDEIKLFNYHFQE